MLFQRPLGTVRRVHADPVQKDALCNDLSGIFHQKLQNGIFCPGQLNGLSLDSQRKRLCIQRQISNRKNTTLPMLLCPAELDRNAGQKLLGVKGLCHIICCASQQKVYLILHIHLCTENDHRDLPNMRQNLLAGKSGQHQIQQHQIHFFI